jgi:hypothetical protein
MNDKEIIMNWTTGLSKYQREMLEDMMQKARQDERVKFDARWEKLEEKINENLFEPDYYSKKPRNIEKMVKVSLMKQWMHELETGKVGK